MANTVKNNAWLNYVHASLIHEGTRTLDDGSTKTFYNVSFPCDKSKSGYASVSVSAGQVLDAKNKAGVAKDGYKSILLGKPETVREVSIVTKKATKKNPAEYGKLALTNAEIADAFNSARAAYSKSVKTAVAATADEQ